jgi:hypothetical protein
MIRRVALPLLLLLSLPRIASGYGAGVFGYSGKPPSQSCNDCHSGGLAPDSVTLSGPTMLGAGEKATFTLDVVTGASTAHVGFDIAASAGTLAKIAGQPNESFVNSGEITHTKNWPKGATVQLMFSLTAPDTPGTVTLFVNALRSDGVDDTGGDRAAGATLDVTVSAPPDLAGADLAGEPLLDLSTVDAVSSATTVKPTPTTSPGPPRDEAHWACDCRVGGRSAPAPSALPVLLPLGLFVILMRRRLTALRR